MTALAIAAFRRPWYLARQLDAWRRVRGIGDVSLCHVTLGWSERYDEQRAVLAEFEKWAPFEVIVSADDPPAGHNAGIGCAIEGAFGLGAGFVFFTDEDILPADDTLELVGWAEREFRDDPRVLTVAAHSQCGQGWDGPWQADSPDADPAVVRLLPYFNMWGWGTWADRWAAVIAPAWDWDGLKRGCDWNMQALVKERGLSAVPDASRTQHIGYRGGLFANPQTLAFSDAASFREHRPPVEFVCAS